MTNVDLLNDPYIIEKCRWWQLQLLVIRLRVRETRWAVILFCLTLCGWILFILKVSFRNAPCISWTVPSRLDPVAFHCWNISPADMLHKHDVFPRWCDRCHCFYRISCAKEVLSTERIQDGHVIALTRSFRALRRKNALQLSQVMAPKLNPCADDPHTTQIREPSLLLTLFSDVGIWL